VFTCEHGYEPLGSIKSREFLAYHLLKQDSAMLHGVSSKKDDFGIPYTSKLLQDSE
jgi:hypothetical protein